MLDGTWRKAERSNQQGACVEVRTVDGVVQMRDSKDQGGPVLTFDADAWMGFVRAVRDGGFAR